MKFFRGEVLRPYNTLALQARAEAFVTVDSDADLVEALNWARGYHLPVVPLGEGSNVVLAADLNALVIHQKTCGVQVLDTTAETVSLRVAAGENWHQLVQWTLQNGYYGLENLALIPGTAGAAPIQNIGAYGVELQSVMVQVHARKIADGQHITIDKAACEFGYRDSVFKGRLRDQLFVTAIDIELQRSPDVNTSYPALHNYFKERDVAAPTPRQVFDAVVSIRRSKLPDPGCVPNAGSFFGNPLLPVDAVEKLIGKYPDLPIYPQANGTVKVSAGWMIDHCGWKGFRRDGVGVHPQHALVLVNYGSDSGEQLLALASEIAIAVHDSFGIDLEIEPRVYGPADE